MRLTSISLALAAVAFPATLLATSGAAVPPGATIVAQDDDATAQYDALVKEATEAINAWRTADREKAMAARKAGQPHVSDPNPAIAFAPRFLEAASQHKGTEHAVPFLTWVLRSGIDGAPVADAMSTLAEAHAMSERLAEAASVFPTLAGRTSDDAAMAFLTKVHGATPNAAVRGWAHYGQHATELTSGDIDSEAYQTLYAAVKKSVEAADDERLTTTFGREIIARVEFAIGRTAPDIVGIDLSGVEFKLSDYEGKVIFLDFWGDW